MVQAKGELSCSLQSSVANPSPEQVHIAKYEGYETMVERTRLEMCVNSETECIKAMLSPPLRITDGSSVAEGPVND